MQLINRVLQHKPELQFRRDALVASDADDNQVEAAQAENDTIEGQDEERDQNQDHERDQDQQRVEPLRHRRANHVGSRRRVNSDSRDDEESADEDAHSNDATQIGDLTAEFGWAGSQYFNNPLLTSRRCRRERSPSSSPLIRRRQRT